MEKADPSFGSYLKNFRALIKDMIQNAEAYDAGAFTKKYNSIRDAVVTFHFGPSKDTEKNKGDR